MSEKINTYELARNMSAQDMTDLLSEWLNVGMKEQGAGKEVGKLFQREHRTLQGSVYRFCLGLIIGLSEQEYTDARNEVAVKNGKVIAEMVKEGKIEMGWMI